MRSTILGTIATSFLVLISSAHAQFLQLAQFDNGVDFTYFVQANLTRNSLIDIVGVRPAPTGGMEITALLGNGTGGFGSPVNTVVAGVDNVQPGLILGDFNGDGIPDVAVFGTDHVSGAPAMGVMLGNGNGTFQTLLETSLQNNGTPVGTACSAKTGAFAGTSNTDFAYLTHDNGLNTLVVLPGNGNGTFSTPRTSSLGLGSIAFQCLTVGDFNNDKKIDAVLSEFGHILMSLGNGDGTFRGPSFVAKAGTQLIAADMNGDGNLDLVTLTPGEVEGNRPAILFGDGKGHFPGGATILGGTGGLPMRAVAVQDLNGDGRLDVAIFNSQPQKCATVSVLLNNGNGVFTAGGTYTADGAPPIFAGAPSGFLAADLNGDRNADLAFPNSEGGISVLLGKGDGTYPGNPAVFTLGTFPEVSDFNGDKIPDLVLGGPTEPVQVLIGNGDGTFTVEATPCTLDTVAIGDYNGDNRIDIAGNSSVSSVPVVSVCLGNGDGTFTAGGNFDQGVTHGLVVPGNFTNNGKLDLAATDTNGFSVLLGEGDGAFENGIPTSASVSTLFSGNFTNDTKLDIIALTLSGAAVFPGNRDGTFGSPIITPGTPTQGNITVTDLNNDGKRDVIITNNTGHLYVLLGNGDGTFKVTSYTLGAGTVTRAVVGDFNGDGKLDLAFGLTGNQVGLLFGDGTGKFTTPPTKFRAGGPVTGIATADFNLDKKQDLVILEENSPLSPLVTMLNQE